MFGKHPWPITDIPSGCGRSLRPHSVVFPARKLKCEISREALFVAPKSLIESSRRNAIYARKLGIQHDLLIANRQNSDVRSFVSHSSNRRILSFAPVHSSRRYQLFVDCSQDAVLICDRILPNASDKAPNASHRRCALFN